MQVINLSKKVEITANCKEAASFSDKLLGLLKKSNTRCLMFRTHFGVHTFGLKEEIEVVVLNNDQKVVKLAVVKPNGLFFWNPKYSLILELPKGTLEKSRIEVADQLQLI